MRRVVCTLFFVSDCEWTCHERLLFLSPSPTLRKLQERLPSLCQDTLFCQVIEATPPLQKKNRFIYDFTPSISFSLLGSVD